MVLSLRTTVKATIVPASDSVEIQALVRKRAERADVFEEFELPIVHTRLHYLPEPEDTQAESKEEIEKLDRHGTNIE